MFRSDVRSYWFQSFTWRSPFSAWWVPGYSLVIALVRALTLGRLKPLTVMVSLGGAAYLVAVITVHRIARAVGSDRAFEIALLFALFPLVGLTYAVFPISDIGAIACFFLAILAMERERWGWFTVWMAAALLFHKVMWFFGPPLLLMAFVKHPAARRVVPLAVVPLLAWIVGGAMKFHGWLWFIRFNVETHTSLKQGMPVFGGLLETLEIGSPTKLAKGAVIVSTLLAALITGVLCARRRLWLGVWIAGVVAFLVAGVNAYEIWIAVRYSKLLVIPWAMLASGPPQPRRRWPPLAAMLLAALTLLGSNLAYGHYLAHYFHEASGH